MSGLTDNEVLELIREHGFDHTAERLGRRFHVGVARVARLAETHALPLAEPSKRRTAGQLRYDERGYCRKLCPCCMEWLGVEYFSPDEATNSGLHSWCKTCANGSDRLRYTLRTLQEAFL